MDLEFITKHEGYEYVSMTFATVFILPQLWSGYRSGSLKDVSAFSYWLLFFGSSLWVVYMIEYQYILYAVATSFVTCTSFAVLCMKFYYYQGRVNAHFRSFDQNPPTLSIMTTSSADATDNQV